MHKQWGYDRRVRDAGWWAMVHGKVSALREVCDTDSMVEHVQSALGCFDLQHVMIAALPTPPGGTRMARIENIEHVLGSALKPHLQEYLTRSWQYADPFLAHALRSSRPLLFSQAPCRSDGQRALMRFAARRRIRSGIVFSSRILGGRMMLVQYFLGGERPELVDPLLSASATILGTLAGEVAAWWEVRDYHRAKNRFDLSDPDVHMMRLAASGLTAMEIAEAVGFTRSQVYNRFRRLNHRFGVNNLRDAVEKAMAFGLL